VLSGKRAGVALEVKKWKFLGTQEQEAPGTVAFQLYDTSASVNDLIEEPTSAHAKA